MIYQEKNCLEEKIQKTENDMPVKDYGYNKLIEKDEILVDFKDRNSKMR